MLKTEYLIIGIILVVVGLGLATAGYQKNQPSKLEQFARFAEEVSGERNLAHKVREPRGEAYFFMGAGGLMFLAGLGVLFRAGKSPENTTQSNTKHMGGNS